MLPVDFLLNGGRVVIDGNRNNSKAPESSANPQESGNAQKYINWVTMGDRQIETQPSETGPLVKRGATASHYGYRDEEGNVIEVKGNYFYALVVNVKAALDGQENFGVYTAIPAEQLRDGKSLSSCTHTPPEKIEGTTGQLLMCLNAKDDLCLSGIEGTAPHSLLSKDAKKRTLAFSGAHGIWGKVQGISALGAPKTAKIQGMGEYFVPKKVGQQRFEVNDAVLDKAQALIDIIKKEPNLEKQREFLLYAIKDISAGTLADIEINANMSLADIKNSIEVTQQKDNGRPVAFSDKMFKQRGIGNSELDPTMLSSFVENQDPKTLIKERIARARDFKEGQGAHARKFSQESHAEVNERYDQLEGSKEGRKEGRKEEITTPVTSFERANLSYGAKWAREMDRQDKKTGNGQGLQTCGF